jgi:hypothetical protein
MGQTSTMARGLAGLAALLTAAACHGTGTQVAPAGIASPAGNAAAEWDLVATRVQRRGEFLVFTETVSGRAGASVPTPVGKLAGSSVFSYVWPTSLDPAAVGFEGRTGILALAATAHPDFDDTPLYDEDRDGDRANDGRLWHAHWVVLTPDEACGAGALKVRDIPEGTTPKMPATWPKLPLFIDSPGFDTNVTGSTVEVPVPLRAIDAPADFTYDGVTAALRVNASVHDPLLCVADVFDVASGNLSLPGRVR